MSLRSLLVAGIFGATLSYQMMAQADMITDGSVGAGVSLQGPHYQIDQSLGVTTGPNLIHSFSRFSIGAGESATFSGSNQIDNVIVRVIGGTGSVVNGRLSVSIPDADFYLIDPAGIVFGENAQLDMTGSIYLATAGQLRFADGVLLGTDSLAPVSFTSASPVSFGFLDGVAGAIVIEKASLSLGQGKRFFGAAGSILMHAGEYPVIRIASGRVDLVTMEGEGSIDFTATPRITSGTGGGRIELQGDPSDDDGPKVPDGLDNPDDDATAAIDLSGNPNGRLSIQTGVLSIEDFSIDTANSGDISIEQNGIELTVNETLTVAGESILSSNVRGTASGGDILVSAGQLIMKDGAQFVIDVNAAGPGGDVLISADTIHLSGDAEIASDVEGDGDGGTVQISAGQIFLNGDPEISSDTEEGSTGNGGSVTIVASSGIYFGSESPVGSDAGLFSNSEGSGRSGNLNIVTPELVMAGGIITASTQGTGKAGQIAVNADRLVMSNGAGISSSSTAAGAGGTVRLSMSSAYLSSGAGISASSTGTGNSGDLIISSRNDLFLANSSIATSATLSDGGNIAIMAGRIISLEGSSLTTSVQSGVGNGGNITVATPQFIVLNRTSRITANAFGGDGGNIDLASDFFISSPDSSVSASSQLGIDGDIQIVAPDIDVSGGLIVLGGDFLDVSSLLVSPCSARVARTGSVFTIEPRRLPISPRDELPGLYQHQPEVDIRRSSFLAAGATAFSC